MLWMLSRLPRGKGDVMVNLKTLPDFLAKYQGKTPFIKGVRLKKSFKLYVTYYDISMIYIKLNIHINRVRPADKIMSTEPLMCKWHDKYIHM